MHIGVDFDDVLYPYHHYLKARLKRLYGIDLHQTKMTSFYYEDHPSLIAKGITRERLWKEVQAAWHDADDHAQAALLDPDASRVLRDLRLRHKVTLITARHGNALPTIEPFLTRHDIRPHDIQIGKHDKSGFDVLVDDFPEHAEQNARSGGYGLLYTIDENSNYDESRHPRILRVNSWNEVAQTIARLEKRRPTIA